MDRNPSSSARIAEWYPTLVLPAVFALLVLAIAASGYFYYLTLKKSIQRESRETLTAIMDFKARQFTQWMAERRADAEAIRADRFLAKGMRGAALRDMRVYMEALQQHHRYQAALLLDPKGTVILALGAEKSPLGATAARLADQAVDCGCVVLSDFYSENESAEDSRKPRNIRLDMLAPIKTITSGKEVVAGLLLLRIDPRTFLYPLVQSWPTNSASAETMLVRAQGQDVVFLNELRRQSDTALTLRMPLESADLPAAMVARNQEEVAEGIDYRGIAVLAAIRGIPDTPWFMVATVDAHEVFAPLKKGGRMVLTASLLLVSFAAVAVFVVWLQQVSAAHHRECAAAERAAANKELEAFIHAISHDPLSPLNGMDGYAKQLQEALRSRLDTKSRSLLDQICAGAREMGRHLEDLMAFTRLDRCPLNRERIDMSALFQAVYEQIRAAEPGRALRLELRPIPSAFGDPALIREVVRHLMGNAAKFTRTRPSAYIQVGALAAHEGPHGYRTFFVKDNGVGFDMRHADKLFGVFQRLHPAEDFTGSGMGLAIVKRIVERHGGKVWAQATADEGAVFFISIPSRDK